MSAPFQIPSDEINFEPQSYGDPNGRVFGWQDQIYRGIKRQKTDFYKELVNSALIQTLIQKQVLIPTEITNLQLLNYGLVLKHKKLPIISYAFEWSFDALKDAALVILSLQAELSKNGLTLQDAHPWNVLFDGSHPLFVDFCSIVPAVDRSWRAYDEFRRFFLNPLRLMSEGQGRIARWLLHDDNAGVSDYEFSCILDGKRLNNLKQQARRWLRPVRAALHESLSPSVRSAIKKVITRRGEAFTSDSLEETRRQIEALQLPSKNTIWSDYFRDYFSIPFVPSPEWSPKEHSVHQVLCKLKPSSVLDIGCNTGWYSQLAASMGSQVIGFDNDEICVNTLYSSAKLNKLCVHPLVMNFLNPTGGLGLNNQQYPPATQRIKCRMVMALALTHHLVFQHKLNFEQITDALFAFSTQSLLVEFVPKEDRYVADWSEGFDWYTLNNFQEALRRKYKTITIYPSNPSPRVLLLCE